MLVIASECIASCIYPKYSSPNLVATSGCIALVFRFLSPCGGCNLDPFWQGFGNRKICEWYLVLITHINLGIWFLPCLSRPTSVWIKMIRPNVVIIPGWTHRFKFILLNILVLQPHFHLTHILIGYIYDSPYISLICDTQFPKWFTPIFIEAHPWKHFFVSADLGCQAIC